MELNKLSHRAFAKQIGTSPTTIFHFLNKTTNSLSFSTIQKIVNGTNGMITLDDVMEEVEESSKKI